jgi:P pilus assembly chaperone PapD
LKALSSGSVFNFSILKTQIVQNQIFSKFKGISRIKYLSISFFSMVCFSISSHAQGDLLLFPKRLVFEGGKKSQVLNVANMGKDSVRYFISVVQVRMKEDGSFETITQPDSAQHFADKNFRFFPRNVVLGPNESQTVKVQLINTSQLPAGEYRSHLYFRAEPEKHPLGEKHPGKDSTSISVKLVAVFGISIPVIIRMGESTAKVDFAEASFEWKKDSMPLLKLSLSRSGNMSVYGDISVDHISLQGKITRIGVVKGMALYAPNALRRFNLFLDKKDGIDYHKGRLSISYTTQADARSVKLAETHVVLTL